MLPKTAIKQQVLELLTSLGGERISPTQIGLKLGKDYSQASSSVTQALKSLVASGQVERFNKKPGGVTYAIKKNVTPFPVLPIRSIKLNPSNFPEQIETAPRVGIIGHVSPLELKTIQKNLLKKEPAPALVVWDWKEQPDWNKINFGLQNIIASGRIPKIIKVNTGNDAEAVVISHSEYTQKKADEFYHKGPECVHKKFAK